MSNVIEITSRVAARRLLEADKAFKDLDLKYYQERRTAVVPAKALVEARKAAAGVLVEWTQEYGQAVGIVFAWPKHAVEHAQKGQAS
jgi:hypothetical protein